MPEGPCSVDESSDQANTDLGWDIDIDIGHFTCLGDDTILAFAELVEASLVGRDAGVGVRNVVLGVGRRP